MLAAIFLGCQVLTPSETIPEVVKNEWTIGQQRVNDYYNEPRAFTVRPEQFRWRHESSPFYCNRALANGCFSTSLGKGTITYNVQTPQVIRHEAGHAIMWKLRRKDWQCFEHPEKEDCQ